MGMITEAGTYVLMLLYKMMTLTITKVNVSEYVHFVRTMKEDFEYISTKSNKYKWVKCYIIWAYIYILDFLELSFISIQAFSLRFKT